MRAGRPIYFSVRIYRTRGLDRKRKSWGERRDSWGEKERGALKIEKCKLQIEDWERCDLRVSGKVSSRGGEERGDEDAGRLGMAG